MNIELFSVRIPGRNPLEQLLAEKTRMLENYQTPRTAKEFYETVTETFSEVNYDTPRRFFMSKISRVYLLTFQEHPQESLSLYFGQYWTDIAVYLNNNQTIAVAVKLAFTIPGLSKDILLGRNDPLDKMPIEVIINDNEYKLKYDYSTHGPLRGKIS